MEFSSTFLRVAADYRPMFQQLIALYPTCGAKCNDEIKWAKQALKKDDRIVWFLKWVRFWLAGNLLDKAVSDEATEEGRPAVSNSELPIRKLYTRYAQELPTFSQNGPWGYEMNNQSLGRFKGSLEHLCGLPIKGIQEFVFGNQTPQEVLATFSGLEDDFKREHKELINPYPDDEVWMEFPDGWAWWLLDRASCNVEAKAMGHCGNSPASGSKGVQILSLREPKQYGREKRWEPHCTFILHGGEGGVLGEMKGKNNAKPVERYHKYIVPLLQDHRITGVIGGGYMPDHNFAMDDLSDEDKNAVARANPQILMSLAEYAKTKGANDPGTVSRVQALLGVNQMDGNNYILRTWEYDTFLTDYASEDDEAVEGLNNIINDRFPLHTVIHAIIEALGDERLARNIARAMEYENPEKMKWLLARTHSKDWGNRVLNFMESSTLDDFPETYKILTTAVKASSGTEEDAKKVLKDAIEESVSTGFIVDNNAGDVYWELSPEDGLRVALECERYYPGGFDRGELFEHLGEPYIRYLAEALEKHNLLQGTGISKLLHEAFGLDPLVHPDRGNAVKQKRLFKNPSSFSDAEKHGIRVSRLLHPLRP